MLALSHNFEAHGMLGWSFADIGGFILYIYVFVKIAVTISDIFGMRIAACIYGIFYVVLFSYVALKNSHSAMMNNMILLIAPIIVTIILHVCHEKKK